jgi:high-affinity iron transporter
MFSLLNIHHMSAAFLITLREGLEISIVLAILLGYLVKTGRSDRAGSVWVGAGIAAIVCLVTGLLFHAAVGEFEGKAEQAIEGSLALAAALVLTWMILWMRKNARNMSGDLRSKVDGANSARAIMFIAFVAVAREGFETVLFLLGAETGDASGAQVIIGGLLGLAVSAVVGVLVYRFGKNIDLRVFFRITGVLLIFFAAGLVGKAFHEFRELLELEDGWLFQPAWTITSGPLASGTLYDFLSGLFGWSSDPERIRVIAYVGYLVPVLWLFLKPDTPATSASSDAAAPVEAGVAGH